MIDVSFIVPVFNAEKTLERCIRSIISLEKYNIEVIISDDGSSDNSSNICKELMRDKRIKYIYQNNRVVASARNLGIQNAKGQYISFVDSDDEIIACNFEKMIDSIENNNYDWISAGYNIIKEYKKYESVVPNSNRKTHNIKELDNIIQGYVWGKLYVTQIIKENDIKFDSEMNLAEDMLFNLTYSLYVNKCDFVSKDCYNYYLYNNSLSRKYCNNYSENMNKIKEAFEKLYEVIPYYQDYYERKYGSIELDIIIGYIRNEFRNLNKKRKKFLKEYLKIIELKKIKKEYIVGKYHYISFLILKTRSTILNSLFFGIINYIKG